MRPQTRVYLVVTVCLILDAVLVTSLCDYDNTIKCLDDKQRKVQDVDCTSSKKAEFLQELTDCRGIVELIDCTEQQRADVQQKNHEILQSLDNKCRLMPTTTTTATTEMPLPDCGSTEGWQYANKHIVDCRKKFDKLSKFEYSTKLTKYGICKNSQDLINCLLGDNRLNECGAYQEAFYRELIPHVKFAQLFDCELKIEGTSVPHNEKMLDCNLWLWLSCHNHLLKALPGIDAVDDGFDLKKIITYNVRNIIAGLAKDRTGCSSYNAVMWSEIAQCRKEMSQRCDMLSTPRRDTLWSSVLSLMYEIKTNVYDKLQTLIRIQDICADACNDILTRFNKINNECKDKAKDTPQKVINTFNSGGDTSDDCMKLREVKTCLKNTVINGCGFLEQSVVLNLHSENIWVEAFDICQIDLEINSDGGCVAEQQLASQILDQCSFQTSTAKRDSLLNQQYNATVFCSLLQQASDCYSFRINRCPALEREYWLAELPLMAAANQMIAECEVNYATYGNTKLLPVDQNTCDFKKWVRCLDSLWSALEITVSDDGLSLEGFKEYLALVWNSGDSGDRRDRCDKLAAVDFEEFEGCIGGLSMECKYPMLTIPDGEDHQLQLRNPFDIGQLREFVQNICAEECTETDIGSEFKRCIDVAHEANILSTYPQDIIASSYRKHYESFKCSELKFTKSCIDRLLNPNKCVLFQPGIVHTAAVSEAITVCSTTKPKVSPSTTSSAAPVTASVVFILLSEIFVVVFNP